MLALTLSILLTVYLIIPEAIFRFVFGLFIPDKTFVLTRTEKAFRAALIALIPFSLALALSWYTPGPQNWPFPVVQRSVQSRRLDYKVVASALYSETEFSKLHQDFWPAFTRSARRQARLASWYFLLVVFEAYGAGKLASRYDKLRKNYAGKWFSDSFLSPFISQWHPLLTLPGTEVRADILCTNDLLYQGRVSQYFLKDGELSGIILHDPQRFNRDLYRKARQEGQNPKKEDYWTVIPSQNLYFFADKIFNMNLSYTTASSAIASPAAVEKFLAEELRPMTDELKLSISVATPSGEVKNDTP